MTITLYRLGGTIDDKGYPDPKKPPRFVDPVMQKDSCIIPFLESIGYGGRVQLHHWSPICDRTFAKDSQLYTPEMMDDVAGIMKEDPNHHLIATCGTDNAAENMSVLKKALAGSGKTVVAVSAMVPLSMHLKPDTAGRPVKSDAAEALPFAIDGISNLVPGVYVIGRDMHTGGLQFFDPDTIEKNKTESGKRSQLIFDSRQTSSSNRSR